MNNGQSDYPAPEQVEQIKTSIKQAYEDRFVGLQMFPWTATHPSDGQTKSGDRIQIRVHGSPGDWSTFLKYDTEDKREELTFGETTEDRTQALITGRLYEKPTVPIEHVDYPDDYDLEAQTGAKIKGDPPNQRLEATGPKKHLLRPVNDAVFLENVEIDFISPPGYGKLIQTTDLGEMTDLGDRHE